MSDSKNKSPNDEGEEDPTSKDEEQIAKSEVAATTAEQQEVVDILDKLEPDERDLISSTISYSGPLPPPDYLKGYTDVYPEAAEIIFGWADQEQEHRQEMDKLHMEKVFKTNMAGLTLGFIVIFAFIVGGVLLIFLDKEIYGLALMVPVIGTAITLLVKSNKKENKDKGSDTDDN